MRLCRYQRDGIAEAGLYDEDGVVSLSRLADQFRVKLPTTLTASLLDYLPPDGQLAGAAREIEQGFFQLTDSERQDLRQPLARVELKTPIADSKKVILLAGNYAAHIEEGGREKAVEREQTFPYFFSKPPSTTLTNPGDPVRIPAVSPNQIDWEIELGVVIGRACKGVAESAALDYVAGYTICNDISDRGFQLNPGRKKRDRDAYFDWLHGKWHDTFLPVGPCVLAAEASVDPQAFPLKLKVNGQVMQDASTSLMVFSVAALIATISSFVTLEPGDIISTGTPSGIGKARKPPIFLKPGDLLEAEITGIGVLRNPVV